MSKPPWFRFWPLKYLDGVSGLSDELTAAYTRLFVKMYADQGPLPFDERKLRFLLEKRPQDVRRIVSKLVDLGKLTVSDGMIHNGTADEEMTRKMNGKWGERWGSISPPFLGHSTSHGDEKHNKNYARARDRARSQQKKNTTSKKDKPSFRSGVHIPENFEPDLDWAAANGLTREQAKSEADKFRDYWAAKAGRDATKRDWAATWRNWVRKAAEPQQRAPPKRRSMLEDYLDEMRLEREEERHEQPSLFGPTREPH